MVRPLDHLDLCAWTPLGERPELVNGAVRVVGAGDQQRGPERTLPEPEILMRQRRSDGGQGRHAPIPVCHAAPHPGPERVSHHSQGTARTEHSFEVIQRRGDVLLLSLSF
jgi:hypothetical protein